MGGTDLHVSEGLTCTFLGMGGTNLHVSEGGDIKPLKPIDSVGSTGSRIVREMGVRPAPLLPVHLTKGDSCPTHITKGPSYSNHIAPLLPSPFPRHLCW
jgi:hypothetical protein